MTNFCTFLNSELEEIKIENTRLKREVKRLKNMAFAEEVDEVKNDKYKEELKSYEKLRLKSGT